MLQIRKKISKSGGSKGSRGLGGVAVAGGRFQKAKKKSDVLIGKEKVNTVSDFRKNVDSQPAQIGK